MRKCCELTRTRFLSEHHVYLFGVQLNVLHRLRVTEEHHLFNNVHLLVDVNGFMKSPIIWRREFK